VATVRFRALKAGLGDRSGRRGGRDAANQPLPRPPRVQRPPADAASLAGSQPAHGAATLSYALARQTHHLIVTTSEDAACARSWPASDPAPTA
jgi:hypothetical protein